MLSGFVGRAVELQELEDALAGKGPGRALELLGEPGIGKTRLLDEFAVRAARRGQVVLSGSASELERELPFGVFVDALDEYLQRLEPRRWLAALDDESRAELAHVLPSVPAPPGASVEVLRAERYRTHRAVRRLLEGLAGTKQLVLLLDDLHWADSGSLELVGALLRHPPVAPVLMVLALRPRQIPDRLSAALERARRVGLLARLELAGLSGDEAGELLGGEVSRAVALALFDESGGNPFYLQQLARSVRRRVAAVAPSFDVALGDVDVPDTVAAALGEELAVLDDRTRRVLEGAAVAGDPFELDLAAAGAGLGEASIMSPLDELLRQDLVRPTDVPRRFRFRHPIVRSAVYEAAPVVWRLGAHERCAELLTRWGASATTRAHHVEQAARHGDRAAIAVLKEAGEAVAQRAPAGAARWFGAALRLLPESAPSEERVALLTARGGALAATGQCADALSALADALRFAPAGAVGLRVQLTIACAAVEQLLGRHQAAHARLISAVAELDQPASAQAATLMISLAADAFYRVEYEQSRAWGARALDVAAPLGERPLTAAATAVLAIGAAFAGAVLEGERQRSAAAALIDAMPDEELALRLDAAAHLAGAEVYLDRFGEATAHSERALAVARATGQGELLPMIIPALSTAMLARGRLKEGSDLLDGAVEAARLSGNDQTLAWDLFNRAIFATEAGDLDRALAEAQEAVDLTSALGESFVWSFAGVALATVLMEAGEYARGVEMIIRHAGGAELKRIPGVWQAFYLERLTRSLLALNRPAAATDAAGAAASIATASGLRFPAAMAQRAAASVELAGGDAASAAALALASSAAADELGMRVEAAISRTLAGRALALAGDRDAAVLALQAAADELDACGARRNRDEAEHELGRLGHRPHRRSRPGRADGVGVAALTARELEVARLVVDRKTNAEIAAALFLSQKTVESHIRNLFHKLNMSSRVEVARAVERAAGR